MKILTELEQFELLASRGGVRQLIDYYIYNEKPFDDEIFNEIKKRNLVFYAIKVFISKYSGFNIPKKVYNTIKYIEAFDNNHYAKITPSMLSSYEHLCALYYYTSCFTIRISPNQEILDIPEYSDHIRKLLRSKITGF